MIFLLSVVNSNGQVSIVVEPHDLSILIQIHVITLEIILDCCHLSWYFAFWRFMEWPRTWRQNLAWIFNSVHLFRSIVKLFKIFVDQIFWAGNICKHGFDLIDYIMATFNLKFLDHDLFSIIIYRLLVQ